MSFDSDTVLKLNSLTSDFYDFHAESFSDTRKEIWPGWQKISEAFKRNLGVDKNDGAQVQSGAMHREKQRVSVLDVGCGNLRFERYISNIFDGFEDIDLYMDTIDNCDKLSNDFALDGLSNTHMDHICCDIVEALMRNDMREINSVFALSRYDLVASFALMHHIPTSSYRRDLMNHMVDAAKPGALIAVSFWMFAEDERLLNKALGSTEAATKVLDIDIDPSYGDFLLDWKSDRSHFRFCHSFDFKEIDDIVGSVEDRATEIDRFSSDGRNNALNSYVVLKKKQN